MNLRFICKILMFLLISNIFAQYQTCADINNKIKLRVSNNELDGALVLAETHYNKEGCSSDYYYNLAKVFLSFNKFDKTKKLYKKVLSEQSEIYDLVNKENKKLEFLSFEIQFVKSFFDKKASSENVKMEEAAQSAISLYKKIINGSGEWEQGEPFDDSNSNNSYDGPVYAVEAVPDSGNCGDTGDQPCGNAVEAVDPIEGEEFTDWSFPDFGYLHLLISELYKGIEDYDNAVFHLRQALNTNSFVEDYNNKMTEISTRIAIKGNELLRLNKFDNAIEKYTLALSIDSLNASIHYNLGNSYFSKNDCTNAIKSYKNVEFLEPLKFKASHKIGLCYQEANDYESAASQFEKAVVAIQQLEEKYMPSYNELASSLMKLGSFLEAKQYLIYIIEESPRYYKAYETLGVLCLESTDPNYRSNECALENFEIASKLQPNNHRLKFRLARLYNVIAEEYKENQDYKNMNSNLSEAKKYSRQCRKLKKTYGGAYFELGVAELNLCNQSSGLKALKKAAKYDRAYRSSVKTIIKNMESYKSHCE